MAIDRQQGIQGHGVLLVNQIGLVQQQQRLDAGVFGGHQVAVDQVGVGLGHGREHDDDGVDVGRHRLELVATVWAAQLTVARQLRDDHADTLVAGAPDYAVAGYQGRQVGAQVAAADLSCQFAIQCLDFHLHAEVGDDQTQLFGAQFAAFKGFQGVGFAFGRAGSAFFLNLLDAPVLPAVELAFGHGASEWGVRRMGESALSLAWAGAYLAAHAVLAGLG